jgi:hypothetical protein
MSNSEKTALVEQPASAHALDGFSGYSDAIEGAGAPRPQSAPIVRFNNDATWTIYD